MSKISWNDFHNATQHEIRKTYKLGYGKQADSKLEQAVRYHLDGASQVERRAFYQQFYGRK